MKIGLDVMGGDYAPRKTIQGAVLSLKTLDKNTEIVLFGNKKLILFELSKYNIPNNKFKIVHCPEVIEMGEHAIKSFKNKPNSSISQGFELLKKVKCCQ